MLAIKNIVVATDFSECSDAAVAYARALAGQFGGRLHVLHCVEFIGAADVAGIGVYSTSAPDVLQELEADAYDRLSRLFSARDRDELCVKTIVTSNAPPAAAIVDYAAHEEIDLIVVGTHGRRGLSHLLLGSVAERVVRDAPCPVLTVRHPQRGVVVANHTADASVAQQPRLEVLGKG